MCGKCGNVIDTGFLDKPRRCEAVGCGAVIDWFEESAGLESRVWLLEYRLSAVLDLLKKHGLLDTDYRFKE